MALIGDTSELESLVYAGRAVLPERDSYQVESREGIVQTDIAGGLSRQSVQFTNAPFKVTLTYRSLDRSKAFWLGQFFDRNRGQKFIATLLLGGIELEQFVVQRVSNYKEQITGINGELTVTLEVQPAFDACYNDWAYESFKCVSGSDWAKIFCNTKEGVETWL